MKNLSLSIQESILNQSTREISDQALFEILKKDFRDEEIHGLAQVNLDLRGDQVYITSDGPYIIYKPSMDPTLCGIREFILDKDIFTLCITDSLECARSLKITGPKTSIVFGDEKRSVLSFRNLEWDVDNIDIQSPVTSSTRMTGRVHQLVLNTRSAEVCLFQPKILSLSKVDRLHLLLNSDSFPIKRIIDLVMKLSDLSESPYPHLLAYRNSSKQLLGSPGRAKQIIQYDDSIHPVLQKMIVNLRNFNLPSNKSHLKSLLIYSSPLDILVSDSINIEYITKSKRDGQPHMEVGINKKKK